MTQPPIPSLISEHLDRWAAARPRQEFVVDGTRRITYLETKSLVDRAATELLRLGVEKGDRVAFKGDPSVDFWINFLAVTTIGGIWTGLNPKYTAGELDYVIGDADPRLILETCPLADDADVDALERRRAQVDTLDPAFLVYTSGSTGRPKGAVLTHRGSNVCNAIAVERKGLSDRRMICNLPINHVGAIGDICGRVMVGGGTIFFQARFSPEAMLTTIEAERLNTLAGVPTMLQLVADHPMFDAVDLSSVDLIGWGGAAIPAELLQRLLDKTGASHCTMGYGSTELTGGVTYSGLSDSVELLSTTVGAPDPRQPIRIWHPDGREAEIGESGEIQAKGDYVMAGYWRNPEATAAAFTDDGWLHTGDLAVMHSNGYVEIVGRMSEMFKSGGYNVYPREVELVLETHPAVSMAAVVSVPDPMFQEVGIAYVMSSADLEPDELRSYCSEHLANYKVPKRIEVLDELPMLPIGKVDKPAITALALAADDSRGGSVTDYDPSAPHERRPFRLQQWIDDHRHELVPPVANKQVWREADMIVMIVGGGNERNDFHDDPREEFFYQITGDMDLWLWPEHGKEPFRMPIREGEVYLLPPNLRHSPQRPDPDSVGLVVEYERSPGELDGFEWACPNCSHLVHRVEVQLEAIDEDLPPLFAAFNADEDARTCPNCGTMHPGKDGRL